ncbi:MAG: hypothetical protein Q4C66_07045 [Lachnospiraceae bacterium]|nr:hypothetical protein [Lachnospiraceae bacterium]
MKVKVCLDWKRYQVKPKNNKEMMTISNRLPGQKTEIELRELAVKVGKMGQSFTPAIFSGTKRVEEEVTQMQMFGLDFDYGVSFDEINDRAKRYELPIAFAYHTLSSTEVAPRFRIIFVHDIPVEDQRAAKIIIKMLMKMFPEADKQCSDLNRFFMGGKGLIGEICEEVFNIADLAFRIQQYLFEKDPKKYVRNLECFAKEQKILMINCCLQISRVQSNSSDDGGKTAGDVYIYLLDAEKSPKYQIILSEYQNNVRKIPKQTMQIRTELGMLGKKCQLYQDFVHEEHVPHDERFLLMTNLLHISGGIKRFKKYLEMHNYDMKSWEYYIKYAKDKMYSPMKCEGNCKYANSCNHKTNMVLTVKEKVQIMRLGEQEEYFAIDEVYQHICNCLLKAVEGHMRGIQIIPAQTAIGKTRAYCDLIAQDTERNYLIAVPTNLLKHEIGARLKKLGIEVMVTPSIDEMTLPDEFIKRIKFYYHIGLGRRVSQIMREYMRENRNSDDIGIQNAISKCREYICADKKLYNSRVVVTTHARLVTLSEEVIRRYTVIIDEDILSTFFKNCRTVPLSDIKKAEASENCPEMLRMRLREILSAKSGTYSRFQMNGTYQYMTEAELDRLMIYTNVNDIALAESYQVDDGEVYYFCPQKMQPGCYIVLSATAEPILYKKYFSDWRIEAFPYIKAKYKGTLKQMTAYPMSRQCIHNHKKALLDYLEQFKDTHRRITFLKYEKELDGSRLHFGNTEGIDLFNGKNILVVGTPHVNEFVYKLIGCFLGMDVNQDSLAERRIRNNGYEFNFMTYRGTDLCSLQLYFISKELEQCIGRARLLRNECEVLVLSNFPCEQAELIQEDYLDKNDELTESENAGGPDMAGEL